MTQQQSHKSEVESLKDYIDILQQLCDDAETRIDALEEKVSEQVGVIKYLEKKALEFGLKYAALLNKYEGDEDEEE
jgi:translation elongation factor EF-1beta